MLADFSFLFFSCRSTNDSINHLPISQLPNSKYILSGETTAHNSIDDLVEHYSHVRHDLQNRESVHFIGRTNCKVYCSKLPFPNALIF